MNAAVVLIVSLGALAVGLTGWIRHLTWRRRARRALENWTNNPRRDLP